MGCKESNQTNNQKNRRAIFPYNTANPDQLASDEAICTESTLFSNLIVNTHLQLECCKLQDWRGVLYIKILNMAGIVEKSKRGQWFESVQHYFSAFLLQRLANYMSSVDGNESGNCKC